eukprot:353367-Chlamydomonas_euryale.AAC.6
MARECAQRHKLFMTVCAPGFTHMQHDGPLKDPNKHATREIAAILNLKPGEAGMKKQGGPGYGLWFMLDA